MIKPILDVECMFKEYKSIFHFKDSGGCGHHICDLELQRAVAEAEALPVSMLASLPLCWDTLLLTLNSGSQSLSGNVIN